MMPQYFQEPEVEAEVEAPVASEPVQNEAEPAATAESPEPVAMEKEEEANIEAVPPAAAPAEPEESEPTGDVPAEVGQVAPTTQVRLSCSFSWLYRCPLNLYGLGKRSLSTLLPLNPLQTSSLPLNSYCSTPIYKEMHPFILIQSC